MLRGGGAAAVELPGVAPEIAANPQELFGPVEQSRAEPPVEQSHTEPPVKAELGTESLQKTVSVKRELPDGRSSLVGCFPEPDRTPEPDRAPHAAEPCRLQGGAEPSLHLESPPAPSMDAKRRRLPVKSGPSTYQQFGYSAPPLGQRAELVAARCKQPNLRSLPRGSPDHNYLETRRLPAFVAQAAAATNMEAVAESLKNFCALQAPMAQLAATSRLPLKISIGTLCSGSEMYLTSLPELQGAIRATTGLEVCLDHAWSCEFVRWKREWIWRNFAPRKIFIDAADLCQHGGAYDDVSGSQQRVDTVSVLIAGFSCKDASMLNVHHKKRKDCIKSGEGTTGSTFSYLLNVVKQQQPLLVILENVASLNNPGENGQSNLDYVKEAFAAIGYEFVWRIFDAADVGAPSRRRRLYMTAYKACQALVEEDAAQTAADAAVDRICQDAEQHRLDDFLFADAVVPAWLPRAATIASRDSWKQKHAPLWKKARFAADKGAYRKSLAGNPSFKTLTGRQKDLLLLRLCSFAFPGPASGVIGLNQSCKLSRYSYLLPTQLPTSQYWLVCHSRLQLGAEGVALQGADLVDLPACRPGGPFTDRQLQNLAGNAFHVWQFVVWFLATCEAIQF